MLTAVVSRNIAVYYFLAIQGSQKFLTILNKTGTEQCQFTDTCCIVLSASPSPFKNVKWPHWATAEWSPSPRMRTGIVHKWRKFILEPILLFFCISRNLSVSYVSTIGYYSTPLCGCHLWMVPNRTRAPSPSRRNFSITKCSIKICCFTGECNGHARSSKSPPLLPHSFLAFWSDLRLSNLGGST